MPDPEGGVGGGGHLDTYIRGGGGGGFTVSKKAFSALRASVLPWIRHCHLPMADFTLERDYRFGTDNPASKSVKIDEKNRCIKSGGLFIQN